MHKLLLESYNITKIDQWYRPRIQQDTLKAHQRQQTFSIATESLYKIILLVCFRSLPEGMEGKVVRW